MSDPNVLQAPNLSGLVKSVFAQHPEVSTDVDQDDVRGVMVDWFCHEANHGATKPWGRKARNADGSKKNGDAAVFLREDGRLEIYDIISGSSGKSSWQAPSRSLAPGENGYWAPANPVIATPRPPTPPAPPAPATPPVVDLGTLLEVVVAGTTASVETRAQVQELKAQVDLLMAQIAKGFTGSIRIFGINSPFDIKPKV